MKRLICAFIALLISISFIHNVYADDPDPTDPPPYEPDPEISADWSQSGRYGDYIDITLRVKSGGTLSMSSGGLLLISGTIPEEVEAGDYTFTFAVPAGCSKTEYVIFSVTANKKTARATTIVTIYDTETEKQDPAAPIVQPVVENVSFEKSTVPKGEDFSLYADIIHDGGGTFTAATFSAFVNGVQVSRWYIGTIKPDVSFPRQELQIPGIKTAGNHKVTVYLEYKDGSSAKTVSNYAYITVKDDKGEDSPNGTLKIQNVIPPIKAPVGDYSEVKFSVTNPSENDVKGAEAFLYDASGKQLDSASVYLSEIKANSSEPCTMTIPVTGSEGVRNYTLSVVYKGADGQVKTVTAKFTVEAVAPKEDDPDKPEEAEKPANIKIQTVDAPNQIYSGAKTAIPYTLVNAGKGTAYNVEVYIINNTDGTEIARQYVGMIRSYESTAEAKIPVKFSEIGTYDLTFYAVCESADGGVIRVKEDFEQKVSHYRASIENVAGQEMIWNNTATIEFTVINAGSETMLNVNAYLTDAEGNEFSKIYIGNIEAGEKRERNRFRDVYIDSQGADSMEICINLTYENADGQEFPVTYTTSATFFNDMGGGDMWVDKGGEDFGGMPVEETPKKGIPIIFIIIGGVVVLAGIITVIVIVSKKKRKKSDDDDIDYFLSQLKLNTPQASPVSPVSPVSAVSVSANSPNSEETEYKR